MAIPFRPLLLALAVALAATAAPQAAPQTEPTKKKKLIHGGFVSGRIYLDMTNLRKIAYVTGLLDGMSLTPKLGADAAQLIWVQRCAARLGRAGVQDLLRRYMMANDRYWPNRNPAKFYRALKAGCKGGPAEAKAARPLGGYVTGKELLDLGYLQKRAYTAGLIEGVFLGPAFGMDEARIRPFVLCIEFIGWSNATKAISARLLAEQRLWASRSPAPRYSAIARFCNNLPKTAPAKKGKAG